MTSTTEPGLPPAAGTGEQEVIAFLRAHPTFLDGHPELLRALSIPHPSGDAVSLLERQVALLRDENQRLKRQLDELVTYARENQELNRKINELVLSLMNAVGPQAVFASLERGLREQFGADRVHGLVFAEPAFVDGGELPQFVGRECGARAAFVDVIAQATTSCGALTLTQLAALGAEPGGSAVVMPLVGSGWDGVLVTTSRDAGRYQADMGTEFLTYLRDIVTLVVDPWVKRGR
jgi:uncharacterized protein YigA (DUF484 family)